MRKLNECCVSPGATSTGRRRLPVLSQSFCGKPGKMTTSEYIAWPIVPLAIVSKVSCFPAISCAPMPFSLFKFAKNVRSCARRLFGIERPRILYARCVDSRFAVYAMEDSMSGKLLVYNLLFLLCRKSQWSLRGVILRSWAVSTTGTRVAFFSALISAQKLFEGFMILLLMLWIDIACN